MSVVSSIRQHRIIPGEIVGHDGKFYASKLPDRSGASCIRAEGMWKTTITLFETLGYIPGECEPLSSFQLIIDVWNKSGLPCSYAFTNNQLKEAKELVRSVEDVDIFMAGNQIKKGDFLKM